MIKRALLASIVLVSFGCGDSGSSGGGGSGGGDAGGPSQGGQADGGQAAGGEAATGGNGDGGAPVTSCGEDTDIAEESLGTGADPEAGDFTLDEALDGLPDGPGPLRAIIETELGTVTCELFPDVAPIGVANFVGLARGRRPFKDTATNEWVKGRRYYDGIIFHRVIDDFMAQGGDPLGNGFGGPGYEFANEIGDKSHVPGTLSYANTGAPVSNGSQFFIVAEVPADFLDGGYTIFGLCDPISVVQAITEVETNANDKPVEDIHMSKVTITRCAP